MATRPELIAGRAFVLIEAVDRTAMVLRRVQSYMRQWANQLQAVGTITLKISIASALPLGYAIKQFAEYESRMSRIAVLMDEPAKHMANVRKELGRIATTYGTGMDELQEGYQAMVSGGMEPGQALTDIEHAAKAARGFRISVTGTAEAVRRMAMAYRITGQEATDLMFAMDRGGIDAEEMVQQLGMAAPMARAANLSWQEFGAAIAAISTAVPTHQVMTAIKNITSEFLKPSAEALETAELWGIKLDTNTLKARRLVDVIRQIATMPGKSENEKMQAFAAIFPDVRGMLGIAQIVKNLDTYDEMMRHVANSAGLTEKAWLQVSQDVKVALGRMWEAMRGTVVELGSQLKPVVMSVVGPIISLSKEVANFISKNQRLVVSVAAGTAGMITFGSSLVGVALSMRLAAFTIGQFATLLGVLMIPGYLLRTLVITLVGLIPSLIRVFTSLYGVTRLLVVGFNAWVLAGYALRAMVITVSGASLIYVSSLLRMGRTLLLTGAIIHSVTDALRFAAISFVNLFTIGMAGSTIRAAWTPLVSLIGTLNFKIIGITLLLVSLGKIIYRNRDYFVEMAGESLSWASRLKAAFVGWIDQIVPKVASLGSTLKDTFMAVTSALMDGDLNDAFNMSIMGLQLSWEKFIDVLLTTWETFIQEINNLWDKYIQSDLSWWVSPGVRATQWIEEKTDIGGKIREATGFKHRKGEPFVEDVVQEFVETRTPEAIAREDRIKELQKKFDEARAASMESRNPFSDKAKVEYTQAQLEAAAQSPLAAKYREELESQLVTSPKQLPTDITSASESARQRYESYFKGLEGGAQPSTVKQLLSSIDFAKLFRKNVLERILKETGVLPGTPEASEGNMSDLLKLIPGMSQLASGASGILGAVARTVMGGPQEEKKQKSLPATETIMKDSKEAAEMMKRAWQEQHKPEDKKEKANDEVRQKILQVLPQINRYLQQLAGAEGV